MLWTLTIRDLVDDTLDWFRGRPIVVAVTAAAILLTVPFLIVTATAGATDAASSANGANPATRNDPDSPATKPGAAGQPAARGGKWAPLGGTRTDPQRWRPCQPITVTVGDGISPEQQATVADVLTEISTLTGLTFVDGGRADDASYSKRTVHIDQYSETRWRKTESPTAAGVAYTGPSDGRWFDFGAVYLHADQATGWRFETILKHELAHVVGLSHVSSRKDLMAPVLNPDVKTFGPGDIRGLAAVGVQPTDRC